jgi:parvulin-like peptidyl-prolyl isomerase
MSTFLKTILAVLFCCSSVIAGDVPPTDTAAVVNGAVITTAEYRGELARILRQRKKTEQELDPGLLSLTKKESLETLIGRELLYQESLLAGISVKDAEVDAEFSRLRGKFPNEVDFIASLGKLDLSKEAIKLQILRGMAIQALLDSRFGSKMVVTEIEAHNYYEKNQDTYIQPAQVRLSHILVKTGPPITVSGTTPARKKIEDLQRRIVQGEDFALSAKESDDSESSEKGGDLGYFTPGQLSKKMEDAAFSLAAGQVSPIIEDRFGYHILKVTEHRPKTVLPFEEVRERAVKQLQRERMLAEVNPYLKRLREAARVEIHLASVD